MPGGSDSKKSACNAEDPVLIPELGRTPGGWHGNRLQYSCLGNFTDRGAWQAEVHGVSELERTEQLRLSLSSQPSPPSFGLVNFGVCSLFWVLEI